MNNKSKKSKAVAPEAEMAAEAVNASGFAAEIEELKRDMRSAQIIDWVQKNQQQLIAGAIAVLLILAGISLWKERAESQKESAATLYHQALATTGADKKRAMLELVVKDYGDTGYGSLAHLYLAKLSDNPVEHLQALLHGAATTQEIAWQARLDLAEWYLDSGNSAEAAKQLSEPVGKQYEQLRHYLLAEATSDVAEKKKQLQMSLDAENNDRDLKSRVEAMLAELTKGDQAAS